MRRFTCAIPLPSVSYAYMRLFIATKKDFTHVNVEERKNDSHTGSQQVILGKAITSSVARNDVPL